MCWRRGLGWRRSCWCRSTSNWRCWRSWFCYNIFFISLIFIFVFEFSFDSKYQHQHYKYTYPYAGYSKNDLYYTTYSTYCSRIFWNFLEFVRSTELAWYVIELHNITDIWNNCSVYIYWIYLIFLYTIA